MTQPDDYIKASLMLYREMIQRSEALALEAGRLRERTERQAERIKALEAELASRSRHPDALAQAPRRPWWQLWKRQEGSPGDDTPVLNGPPVYCA